MWGWWRQQRHTHTPLSIVWQINLDKVSHRMLCSIRFDVFWVVWLWRGLSSKKNTRCLSGGIWNESLIMSNSSLSRCHIWRKDECFHTIEIYLWHEMANLRKQTVRFIIYLLFGIRVRGLGRLASTCFRCVRWKISLIQFVVFLCRGLNLLLCLFFKLTHTNFCF